MSWKVETDTVSDVTPLISVDFEDAEGEQIGKARVTVGDNSTNRSIDPGEGVTIYKGGSTVFNGVVDGKPSDDGLGLEFKIAGERVELLYEDVHRPFYEVDGGQAIRDAVRYAAETRDQTPISVGSSTTDWSATTTIELCNFDSLGLHKYGSDLLYVDLPPGSSGSYTVSYSSVSTDAAPGSSNGGVHQIDTRLIANNSGDVYDLEFELRDNGGRNYVWSVDEPIDGTTELTLYAEDATSDGAQLTTNGTFELRIHVKGELSEGRALAIDHVSTIPYKLIDRGSSISVSGVEDTGNEITRRFDGSLLDMVEDIAGDAGMTSHVSGGALQVQPEGQATAPVDIDYDTTPVVEAEFDRDYSTVRNKAVVQSDAGQVEVRDGSSVDYYGVSSRTESVVDKSIQSRDDATRRGKAKLGDRAWRDTTMRFTIADSAFASSNVRAGQSIYVYWPPENIDAEHRIESKQVLDNGFVEVTVSGHTG